MRTYHIPLTEISFQIDTKPSRPPFIIMAEGYEDFNEKIGCNDVFIHYIEVKYRGRNITRLLKKRPECRLLWDTITEDTIQKIYEEINNKIYESD